MLLKKLLAPLTARLLVGIADEGEGEPGTASLVIAGTEGMIISFAKCCGPIPGDDIGGHITAGRGVVVHVSDCRNYHEIQERDKEGRSVALRWHDDVQASGVIAAGHRGFGRVCLPVGASVQEKIRNHQ